ncbi:histone H3 [Thecamonas trahens ATCC 50062]|uniref:Histone H3 n=1 Tax=Thecamonas trahens ATCC 50062 TaxID=461836 RepID=A0A0L0D9P9_THETB|nr:histone H3 [Thecamonas trahens ATCC 50062]KNC48980.1 histone H3 [Thecamonas trahens ATCC 50062]|eukprot:XP_013758395.1 histone H3 [Thecamonas trahens ATCC 50062]
MSFNNKHAKVGLCEFPQAVLKQIHPSLSLSHAALRWTTALCMDNGRRMMAEAVFLSQANKRKTVDSRAIQTAVRLILPGELAKHAVSEGVKAVLKTAAEALGAGSMRLGSGAIIYASAVIEYLLAECLELGGNAARDDQDAAAGDGGETAISVMHLAKAMMNDEELLLYLGGTHTSWFVDPMGWGEYYPRPQPIASVVPAASVADFLAANDDVMHPTDPPAIRRLPMQRVIREVAQDYKCDLRFEKAAIALIHAAVEQFVAEMFEAMQAEACAHGRTTVTCRDLQAARCQLLPSAGMLQHYFVENNPFLAPIAVAEEQAKLSQQGDGPSANSQPSKFFS